MNDARKVAAHLASLLRREHSAMADFLVAVASFDRGRLWLELGYRSLFEFLHRELGLSKSAAHFRKVAAELVGRFPEIVEPLQDGRLCITSVVELAKVISPENCTEVLPRFFHRSKREAMEVVAELRPAESVPARSVVTAVRLASPPSLASIALAPNIELTVPAPAAPVRPAEHLDANSETQPHKSRNEATPLTAELSRLHVTVSRRFLAKLQAARDALSHSKPGATDEELLESGLDLLLKAHAQRKGLVEKPRSSPRPSTTDRFPAHVKRAVWIRDGGRCQWQLASGEICGCTSQVEFAHVESRARGGPPTVENTRLLCRIHNQYEARLELGDAFMDRFTRRSGEVPSAPGT
ncbi:MAG TPA: HNH endonuclease [Anaeromyxobacter sp.]|nr:HNH endonuclease [Anaeromyxobacter sp.]